MQTGYTIVVLFALLAVAASMFVPNEFAGDEEFGPSIIKRNYYDPKPLKRQFNADDLTLRFGKRSDMAFRPDQLSLRFGRR
ncbi:unnamed protein product [Caenorhabditis bovis]|uniref:Uncharacterized protein n=1 Tax=Caenorhabditis bovis TaxID=2654633 RepID=A0A8S1ESX5_9PELO|nr:unnamed protein product [Caenorhabditis bovis]